MSSSSAGRRRATDRHYSAEDQALDQISKEAEERLQAKRQARAEAREFRMREIERQQKEEEEKQKSQQQGAIDTPKIGSYSGSRRGSDESSGSEVSSTLSQDPKDYIRELKSQLRELEEKYKHAMVTNAQLDNTKTTHVFQIELLKEKLEEQDETMIEVQREYKEKSREYELLKRDFKNLQNDCDSLKQQSEIKDRLLQESGLVIISSEEGQLSLSKCSDLSDISIASSGTALISQESAEVLQKAGEGSLGNSNQVNILVSKPDVVVDVDSVMDTQSKSQQVTNVPVSEQNIMHAVGVPVVSNATAKNVEISDSKEQVLHQVCDETENNKLNNKDSNSNSIKQNKDLKPEGTDLKDQTDNGQRTLADSSIDQTDNKLPQVDSGIKIEIDLLADDERTETVDTEVSETYGLSKSMVERLQKMSEGNENKQGLCTSISFESDVTYHRESEDELLDNDDDDDTNITDSLNSCESENVKATLRIGNENQNEADEKFEENKLGKAEGSGKKAEFRIGDENEMIADKTLEDGTVVTQGSLAYQFINKHEFQPSGWADNLIPNDSVDDVSSMLVSYDPNETASVGDYTDDRFEEFESNLDSGEDEGERKGSFELDIPLDIENSEPSTLNLTGNAGLIGLYKPKRFQNVTQSFDDVSSMLVEYDPSETVSVDDTADDIFEDAVDNTEMTVANVEQKDYVPGNMRTIDCWIRSISREEVDMNQGIEESSEVCTSFLTEETNTADNVGSSPQLQEFAKGYVKGIIKNAMETVSSSSHNRNIGASIEQGNNSNIGHTELVDQTPKATENANPKSGQSVDTEEPLNNASATKSSFSDEILLPFQRPSERSSIDILSPITHVTEETSDEAVGFFSYKLQTQASIVLSSTEKTSSGDVTIEKRNEDMSPCLSDISGFGVCLSGEGLEEMEKYYKEMAALSETERLKGLADGLEWNRDVADQIQMAVSASPIGDDVFFAADEDSEKNKNKEKENSSSEEPDPKAAEENSDLSAKRNKAKTAGVVDHCIVDDWAKKDYEIAAGHNHQEVANELKNITDDLMTESGENETEQQVPTNESSSVDSASKNLTHELASSGAISKKKKGKKGSKSSTSEESKIISAEARSSASDVDKRSSGSAQSGETDADKTGKKGSHPKKKSKEGKDPKDENCSVS